jgi:hypothetical protein
MKNTIGSINHRPDSAREFLNSDAGYLKMYYKRRKKEDGKE